MDCLYLMSCGVPHDVAFGLDEAERVAWIVGFGTLAGRQFDWQALRWDC